MKFSFLLSVFFTLQLISYDTQSAVSQKNQHTNTKTSTTTQTNSKKLNPNPEYAPNQLIIQFRNDIIQLPTSGYSKFKVNEVTINNKTLKKLFSDFEVLNISRTFDADEVLQAAQSVYSPADYEALEKGINTYLRYRYVIEITDETKLDALKNHLEQLTNIIDNTSYNDIAVNAPNNPATNDPFLADQYYLDVINIRPVWERGITNANQAIVGVIEIDFIDRTLPDFQANVTHHQTQIDDGAFPCPANIDLQHGNGVTSVIGAEGNNGSGISGIFWNGKMQAWNFKQLSLTGCVAYISNAERAIANAVMIGAKIFNRSFHISTRSFNNWIDRVTAGLPNIIVVQAAGNQNCDLSDIPAINNLANLPNLILVGATNEQGNHWVEPGRNSCDDDFSDTAIGRLHGSNYGDNIHILAPGKIIPAITSTGNPQNPQGITYWTGTSFSAPQVTGALSLAWSICPNLSASELKNIIEERHGQMLDVNHLVSRVEQIRNQANQDSDNDGIPDLCDNCPNQFNQNQRNTDGDAYGDSCDPDRNNPQINDIDEDGVIDFEDNCPEIANFTQRDEDNDGIGDACDDDDDNDGILNNIDVCIQIFNPDQRDTDNDGLGDACDPDDDNDGVLDNRDNCQLQANINQNDRDADGIGDACDNDIDGDGVINDRDNCPIHFNPDQTNLDEDIEDFIEGDACDDDIDGDGVINEEDCSPFNRREYIVLSAYSDGDRDGIADSAVEMFVCCDNLPDTLRENGFTSEVPDPEHLDNCPGQPNRDQANLDNDIYGDACDDDDDNDGVADGQDNCPRVANNGQLDSDGDGVGDACSNDLDGDGIVNNQDNCPDLANQDQSDFDNDGIGNTCDNCPNTSNRNQLNSDNDPYGNACDLCPNLFHYLNTDIDGDGIGDPCDDDDDNDGINDLNDNCPAIPNNLQNDLDRDGLGDACDDDIDNDGIPNDADPCNEDPNLHAENPGNNCIENRDNDHDGIPSNADNCPNDSNPDQADLDEDGLGNVCDNDIDGDTFSNNIDNCPMLYNPTSQQQRLDCNANGPNDDRDGDGLANRNDPCPFHDDLDENGELLIGFRNGVLVGASCNPMVYYLVPRSTFIPLPLPETPRYHKLFGSRL